MTKTANKFNITAEAHSDDRVFEVPFDALPWFQQASDEEVIKLARCGWGGDYPADHVAEFMVDHVPALAEMFGYIERLARKRRDTGFECHVNKKEALAWLKANKPVLAMRIEDAE